MVGGIGGLLGGIFMRGNKSNLLRQGALYSLSIVFIAAERKRKIIFDY